MTLTFHYLPSETKKRIQMHCRSCNKVETFTYKRVRGVMYWRHRCIKCETLACKLYRRRRALAKKGKTNG